MLNFAAKQVFFAIPTLFGVTLLVFGLVHLAPGDAADMLIPPDVSKEFADTLRRRFGLDQPIYIQYGLWLMRVLTGDFGVSIFNSRPILPELIEALTNTLRIALPAAFFAFVLGVSTGIASAIHSGKWQDRLLSFLSISAVSIPNFWLAIALVAIFSVKLDLFPAIGMGDPKNSILENIRFMILPIIALSMIPFGIIAQFVRAMVLEIIENEFVTALQAKGLLPKRVVFHIAKNAAPPTLALMGLQFQYVLGKWTSWSPLCRTGEQGVEFFGHVVVRGLLVLQHGDVGFR